MQLEDFFDYKNQLMEDLLTREHIVRLINPNIDIKDSPKLMYKNVFPYEFIPPVIEFADTFICCDVDLIEPVNKTFLTPYMYVWVFTHESLLRLPEGGVRTDKLVSEIAKAVNGSWRYGLGEMELYSVRRFAPATDYNGKVMTFHMKEFNRPSPQSHPIPAHRKRG